MKLILQKIFNLMIRHKYKVSILYTIIILVYLNKKGITKRILFKLINYLLMNMQSKMTKNNNNLDNYDAYNNFIKNYNEKFNNLINQELKIIINKNFNIEIYKNKLKEKNITNNEKKKIWEIIILLIKRKFFFVIISKSYYTIINQYIYYNIYQKYKNNDYELIEYILFENSIKYILKILSNYTICTINEYVFENKFKLMQEVEFNKLLDNIISELNNFLNINNTKFNQLENKIELEFSRSEKISFKLNKIKLSFFKKFKKVNVEFYNILNYQFKKIKNSKISFDNFDFKSIYKIFCNYNKYRKLSVITEDSESEDNLNIVNNNNINSDNLNNYLKYKANLNINYCNIIKKDNLIIFEKEINLFFQFTNTIFFKILIKKHIDLNIRKIINRFILLKSKNINLKNIKFLLFMDYLDKILNEEFLSKNELLNDNKFHNITLYLSNKDDSKNKNVSDYFVLKEFKKKLKFDMYLKILLIQFIN